MNDHTNDPDEQQIRDALRGVAESGGTPDQPAAWDAIQRGIAADERSGGRRRWLLGGAGLAVAGAAAALVLVVGTGDDEEAVEVGPAAESTTTTSTSAPAAVEPEPTTTTVTVSEEEGTLVERPEHPVAVVLELEGGNQRLDLYDADTGEVVIRGLAESIFSIDGPSVVGDTVYFTQEGGDSSQVMQVPWDGSAEPSPAFGLGSETSSPAISPDGSTFAFVEQGITIERPRIGLLPITGGDIRYLEWSEDEEDFFLTQGAISDLAWSPDGTRLAFVSSYEGSEVRVVDIDAASLSDSVPTNAAGVDPAWSSASSLVFIRDCCYPDFSEPTSLASVSLDDDGAPTLFDLGEVVSAAQQPDGWSALVLADGTARAYDSELARTIELAVEGAALEVGL